MAFRLTVAIMAGFLVFAGEQVSAQDEPVAAQRAVDPIVGKLLELQRGLEEGEAISLELVAGGSASSRMATVPPRDTFLQIPFAKARDVRAVPPYGKRWELYVLAGAPGSLRWRVEVELREDGGIERVMMMETAPVPF